MAKYRKKPVVIEAIQWKPKEMLLKDVFEAFGCLNSMGAKSIGKKNGKLVINTLEGEMIAEDGDYIIKGVQGEFYPCKPDIFEETYEKVKVDNTGYYTFESCPKCGATLLENESGDKWCSNAGDGFVSGCTYGIEE